MAQPDASRSSSPSSHREQIKDPQIGSSKANQERANKRPITPIDADNWDSGEFERTAMINIICPTAYQNQLLSDFISAVRQPVQAPTFRCHSMWLRDVALGSNQSSCLTWAVRAISVAHLGRVSHDPHLIETSRRVYGRALLNLNAALQDPVEGLSSNTLSAIMILSFYEIFNCTDRNSWVKHAGGAAHLMRLRGPARHLSGTDRTMFIACRYSLIMESFQNRTACFLDKPEWRALGWKIHEDLKRENPDLPFLEANEQFFQEIVTHPAYLRDAIDAVANPRPEISHLQSLLDTGHTHRTNYQAIHARLVNELRIHGREPTRVASSNNDPTFPIVYDHRDIHIASLYVGYWAVLCAINIALIGLQSKLAGTEQQQQQQQFSSQREPVQSRASGTLSSQSSQAAPAFSATSSILHPKNQQGSQASSQSLWDAAASYSAVSSNHTHLYIAENATYAREICKSVEHMQRTPFIGPLFLVLALRMALRMGISRREKQWILDKLGEIGENMGIAKGEVEVYWNQRTEAEAQGKGKGTGFGKGPAKDASKRSVGRGFEMPNVGVVGFSEDEDDVNEGGLDPAGPPVVETASIADWNRSVLDPAVSRGAPVESTSYTSSLFLSEEAGSGGGLGWGEPTTLGYPVGEKGLLAEMTPVGSQGGNDEFGTVGGLGVEWEESASLLSEGEGQEGLSRA